jgi:hypothetical protein
MIQYQEREFFTLEAVNEYSAACDTSPLGLAMLQNSIRCHVPYVRYIRVRYVYILTYELAHLSAEFIKNLSSSSSRL